jgi:hypothetical protein
VPWGRLDDEFDDDPDIDNMSTDAIALFACSITYCCRKLTDGFVSEARARKLPGGNDQAISELCAGEKPWWVKVDGGYQIRSFLKFNPSGQEYKERQEEISRIRSEAGRKGGLTTQSKNQAKEEANSQAKDEICLSKNQAPNPESRIPIPEIPKPKKSIVAFATTDWDLFCSIYPKRNGSLNRAKAQEKFKHLARDHPAILQGARNYRAWADATGKTGTQFIKQMDSWLTGKLWLEDYQAPNGMMDERDRILEALSG